ncbi:MULTISPECIES: GlxA family transcriptional regulator [unclassified Pseudomonas]|uniref:GlxA family transcriptional regulator n=1 Tax=unclassified Pseudomonas TaxID=196821 RepID=UPI0015B903F2|nr:MULTISPECIES: helix-turn-helix domain-containing protein [unclassified Pseudomonas]MCS4245984.1 transcriptional regulator GlxA family with amidase domain [Pseudomonas sp. BIGb0164]NWE20251.1 helix-turn-helix domain-containing protein [Pseudomonas sp. P7548]
MRLSILALEGLFDTGLSVFLDAFSLANTLSPTGPVFEVSLVGVRKKVRTRHGLLIPTQPINEQQKPDWVVLPAPATASPELLVPALARADVRDAKAQLLKWHAQGAQIAASCVGTFFFAETGLLDHRQATTTWWLAPLFRQRYPHVKLDESRMLVQTDVGVTAGAAMGHLDLALWLIRQASPELSNVVSRYLLADIRTLQAPYIIPNHLAQADPLILRFERWSRERLKQGFSLQEAASALATSRRTLQRRCEDVLGKSPLSYFQDLRVERAQSLLHGGDMDIEAIASEVGYADGSTLRTLLRQRLGRGVRELRSDLR